MDSESQSQVIVLSHFRPLLNRASFLGAAAAVEKIGSFLEP